VSGTLAKTLKTLGKRFAECNTRQRALGSEYSGKDVFAECPTLGKGFAECQGRHSAKKSSRDGVFAECLRDGTRQR
jgi:hypothetical protein